MRIALTGSSSTGKTTLVARLRANPAFLERIPNYVSLDAQELLMSMGHATIEDLRPPDLRSFREQYFTLKQEREFGRDDFVTDRSFVDVAAYWIELDAKDISPAQQQPFLDRCLGQVKAYDIHVYCPFGVVPFQAATRRSHSEAFHRRVDNRIRSLLTQWSLHAIALRTADLDDRVAAVCRAVSQMEGVVPV